MSTLITFKIGENSDEQDILVNIWVDGNGKITDSNFTGIVLKTEESEYLKNALPKIDKKILEEMKKDTIIDLTKNEFKNSSVEDIIKSFK